MSKSRIWEFFKQKGFTECGIAGLMGNLQAESNFKANNLQNTGNTSLRLSDEEYTVKVDSGSYSRDKFCKDGQGYGLAQWTYHTRKASLYDYARKVNKSIGDLEMQLVFMYNELKGYADVFKVLKTATTVKEASDIVILKYERPADQSEKALAKRASYGEAIYKEFASDSKKVSVTVPVLRNGSKGDSVGKAQILLNGLGYDCGKVDKSFGGNTEKAVIKFQKDNHLEADGIIGVDTWSALLN